MNSTRRQVIEILLQGKPETVSTVTLALSSKRPTIQRHLVNLRNEGFVSSYEDDSGRSMTPAKVYVARSHLADALIDDEPEEDMDALAERQLALECAAITDKALASRTPLERAWTRV